MADRLQSLVTILELQKKVTASFVRAELAKKAGQIADAAKAYTENIAAAREYLAATEAYNETFPPMDVDSIVQPIVNALFVSADLEQQLGDRNVAESRREEAVALSTRYFGEAGDAEASRSRAASLISEARFNEALVALMKARGYEEQSGNLVGLLRVTLDMVDVCQWLGDYSRAKAELARAAELFKGRVLDKPASMADILAGVMKVATSGSIDKSASDAIRETTQLFRASQELKYYQGLIGKALGEWDDADTAFRAVRDQYAQLGVAAAIDYQLASIELERGKYPEVLAWTIELEGSFTGQMRPKLAALLRIRARALIGLGRHEEAQVLLRKAINDLSEYYDPDLLWRLQGTLADSLASSGDVNGALAAYQSMNDTIAVLRRAPLGHRFDSTYLLDKIPALERAIALACRTGRPEQAWQFIEFLKSRTLTATLSIPDRPPTTVDAERFDILTRELDAIDYQLFRENNAALRRKRTELLMQRERLLERIRISDPRWRNLTQPIAFDLSAVEALARGRKQAVLSLYMTTNDIVSALITPTGAFVDTVPLTNEVRKALLANANNLQSLVPDPTAYDVSLTFDALVTPSIAREALAHESLIVIPHRELHLLPWACMKCDGKRLFERCPVGILPNASSYPMLAAAALPAKGGALAVAPDYSNAPKVEPIGSGAADLADLKKLYEAKGELLGKPLLGAEITEAAVRRMFEQSWGPGSVAHVYCHGTFVPEEPMSSALLLSDSKLDAAEVAGLRLGTDEVVLAACSTGWRPVEVGDVVLSGDDILGLPGAFLEAGARAVLVSITKAHAETTTVFTRAYHEARLDGASPLRAMQQTQLLMMQKQVKLFLFAGFCAYGCN
jgi:CHAT domain-containing protein